jgi:hypothetical protein
MLLARLVKGRTWRAIALDSCFDIVTYVSLLSLLLLLLLLLLGEMKSGMVCKGLYCWED